MLKLRSKRTTAPIRGLCSSPTLLLLPLLLFGATAPVGAAPVSSVALCEGAGCDLADVRYQGAVAERFGFSAAVGYLDGDLLADLVIGAPDAGRVYVFFGGIDQGQENGNASWPEILDSTADVILTTQSDTTRFGFSVAVGLRGNDADLSNRLIVGAPAADKAFVIDVSGASGSIVVDGGAAPIPVQEITGPAGSETGHSVALGPVLLPGGDDFLVGARVADNEAGAVWAIERTATTSIVLEPSTPGLTMVKLEGSVPQEGLGEYLAVGALMPADTMQVAIGAVGTAPSDTDNVPGRVYVIQPETYAAAGTATTVSLATAGTARVVAGDSAKLSGVTAGTNDFFGFSITAGDFDDDGLADLAVGSIYADRTLDECDTAELNSGAVYFFDSLDIAALSTDPTNPTPAGSGASRVFWGHRRWDELGFSVGAGDVNGDGATDLLASARRADRDQADYNEIDEGAVYVIYGGSPEFTGPNPPPTLHTCFDCPSAACDALPPGVDAAIFGSDYADSGSDEIGFFVAAGDFNRDAEFDDVLVTSAASGRAYLVSLNNGDLNEDEDGQETDDLRDVADDDDDGDGYLDTEEDANLNGLFEPALSESDTLVPNRDVTVSVAAADGNTLNCAATVEVTVTVSNVGRRLTVLDPRLRVTLPGVPFAYVAGSTVIVRQGVTTPVTDEAGDTFPFAGAFRSITADGSPRATDPLAATPQGQAPGPAAQIEVVFELEAVLPLPYDTPNTDTISADVELDPADNELPEDGLGQTNSDEGIVTLLRPDLMISKASNDVDGDVLDPEDVIHYTILIANNGTLASAAASNVVLTDLVSADLVLDGGSVTTSQGTVTSLDPVTVDIGTIAEAAVATVEFDATVSALATDGLLLENQATVGETCFVDRISDSADEADNDGVELGNDTADPVDDDTTKDNVTVAPGISLAKAADVETARVGDPVTYTYTVENTGNVNLRNVEVTDDKCAPVTQTDNGNGNANLEPEEIWTYSCAYTVVFGDRPGPLINNATVDAETVHADPVSDTASASVDLAAIALTKVGDPNPVVAGATVTYTFTANNGGGVLLENVDLSDSDATCDADLTFLGGDADSDGRLDVGEDWTWDCEVTAAAPGPLANTGTVTANLVLAGTEVSDTADETVTVGAISLTKTADVATAAVGDTVNYTYVVGNTGSAPVTGLSVSDDVCAPVTLDSGDANSDGILDVGESWSHSCGYVVQGGDLPGPLVNNASADGLVGASPVTAADSASVELGGITLTKTADVATATVGDTVNYTYVVDNTGGGGVTGLSVSDDVCAPVTLDSGDANSDGILDVGESWSHSCGYVVQGGDLPGPLVNNASADGLVGASPVTAADSASVDLGAISLAKTADVATAAVGDTVNYTYVVDNTGSAPVTGLSVSDDVCAPVALDSGDANSDGILDVGESWSHSCGYVVQGSDLPGPLVNNASADGMVGGSPVTAADSASVELGGISLTKTADVATAAVGDTITYTYVVDNAGGGAVTGLSVSDDVCAPVTLDSGDANSDGILDVGESWSHSCGYVVQGGDLPGPLVNNASADGLVGGSPVTAADSASVDLGAISLAKTADVATAAVGDTITYTYVVDNNGNTAVTGLSVSDDVCAPVTLDSGDANSDGILDVGESWSHSCGYVAQGGDLPGPLVNNASADGLAGGVAITAADSASVDLGAIALTKTADVATATAGDTITYTYVVDNNGNTAVTGLSVSDDVCAPVTLDSGDANSDGILDVGESWSHSCGYVVQVTDPLGPLVNNATADGLANGVAVTAADSASVDIAAPLPATGPSIRLGDGGALEWTDVAGAVNYHLYRGDLQTLRESDVYTQDGVAVESERSCWLAETFHDDGYVPEPGRTVFYLVTSDQGSVEGDLGLDSNGVTRPNDNPCR